MVFCQFVAKTFSNSVKIMLYERKIYMLKKEREKEIINILRENNGYATVKSLCSKVRQSMLKNAKKKIFLCDSEKIGTYAPYRQCGIEDIDCLVCEKEIHAPYFAEYKNLQIL